MREPRDWLKDPTLYTTSAIVLLSDEFGTEFMSWDPITTGMELENTYGFEPSSELQDRIQAGCTLFTSNLFHLSLETFAPVCNALNFGTVTSSSFLPPDLDDVLWGVTEARLLLGEVYDEQDFSHNIARYVGTLLSQGGIRKIPRLLQFAEMSEGEDPDLEGTGDDPEMFQAFWDTQQAERDSLELDNRKQILLLMQQLQHLPLTSGSTDFIRERLEQAS